MEKKMAIMIVLHMLSTQRYRLCKPEYGISLLVVLTCGKDRAINELVE